MLYQSLFGLHFLLSTHHILKDFFTFDIYFTFIFVDLTLPAKTDAIELIEQAVFVGIPKPRQAQQKSLDFNRTNQRNYVQR